MTLLIQSEVKEKPNEDEHNLWHKSAEFGEIFILLNTLSKKGRALLK